MCLESADIVKLLIENGTNGMNLIAQIDKDLNDFKMGFSPILGKNFYDFTRRLARHVDNFNAVDIDGNTALHLAISQGE